MRWWYLGNTLAAWRANGKEGIRGNPEAEWVVWVFVYIKRIVMQYLIAAVLH